MEEKIIEYLKEQGKYNEAYNYLIYLIIDQISIYEMARQNIKEKGIEISGDKTGSFYVRNQNLKTLSECITNIKSLSKTLGLSVADSIIFKQLNNDVKDSDGFEEMM